MHKTKIIKYLPITFEYEAEVIDIVGGLKAVELSDDEDALSEEDEAAKMNSDGDVGRHLPKNPKPSKRV